MTDEINPADAATISDKERADLGITTQLPKTLAQGLSAIEADKELQSLMGPEFVKNYLIVKRAESKKLSAMSEHDRRMWLMMQY